MGDLGRGSIINRSKAINRLNLLEISKNSPISASWHDQYKDSPYVYVGGLPFDLTEGDVSTVFSQYGTIEEVNLVRDQETGRPRGFAFLKFKDQRSTVLSVDNLNGITIGGRAIRVDHVLKYRTPEEIKSDREAKNKHKTNARYADLVTEDLFRTAAGEYFVRPPADNSDKDDHEETINELIEDESHAARDKTLIKRPRTEAELQLRKRFKRGELSESQYLKEKEALKRQIKGTGRKAT